MPLIIIPGSALGLMHATVSVSGIDLVSVVFEGPLGTHQ